MMKLLIRIAALSLVAVAAVSNSNSSNVTVASNIPSSVPGGGGPMPSCNPFTTPNCQTIR